MLFDGPVSKGALASNPVLLKKPMKAVLFNLIGADVWPVINSNVRFAPAFRPFGNPACHSDSRP
ncbi:hypothetical protein FHW16_002862 [Phyllobacterium myrsinacearum]|uniref:Uncharacterized protein n=1 Tax=Phyllobacterium myrsinacearum TaxID=28101 RepID=A0A839ENR9_9HYPH|nr:hypothetical protein [Phyllobacterium myrsinacearum]